MQVIILAAGRGKRLEKYTHGLPKCLLKIEKESLLERQIRLLQESGICKNDIYVIGGYKYESLEKIAPNLIINKNYETTDNSYSLALGLEKTNDDVLVLDADLCFEKKCLKEILTHPAKNIVLSKKSADLQESTGIVTDVNMRVKAIGKGYFNTGYVYISIFKIQKEITLALKNLLLDTTNQKTWYTKALTILCSKYEFVNLVSDAKWHEIDFIEDYQETLKMFSCGEK